MTVRLGGDRGLDGQHGARSAPHTRTTLKAVEEIRAAGVVSARGIARELTARKVPTPTGSTIWAPAQVQRLLRA